MGGEVVLAVRVLVLVLVLLALVVIEASDQHAGWAVASVEEEQVVRAPRFVNRNGLHVV